jgi:hypothetical protein
LGHWSRASYWPTADTNPDVYEGDAEFASIMNDTRKVAFSSRALMLEWSHPKTRARIVADEIGGMKADRGRDMLMVGSAGIR